MSQEAIQKRAYEIWLENGCTHGHDREDWLRAEAELSANCQQNCQTVPVAASRTKKAAKTSTPTQKSSKAKK